METTINLSETQVAQLRELNKKQADEAKESMDWVYNQWQSGRLATIDYREKLKVWEDRHFDAIRAGELLEQGYLISLSK